MITDEELDAEQAIEALREKIIIALQEVVEEVIEPLLKLPTEHSGMIDELREFLEEMFNEYR